MFCLLFFHLIRHISKELVHISNDIIYFSASAHLEVMTTAGLLPFFPTSSLPAVLKRPSTGWIKSRLCSEVRKCLFVESSLLLAGFSIFYSLFIWSCVYLKCSGCPMSRLSDKLMLVCVKSTSGKIQLKTRRLSNFLFFACLYEGLKGQTWVGPLLSFLPNTCPESPHSTCLPPHALHSSPPTPHPTPQPSKPSYQIPTYRKLIARCSGYPPVTLISAWLLVCGRGSDTLCCNGQSPAMRRLLHRA